MTTKKSKAIFQLKVRLRDIEPVIWRRIQFWEDTKLPQLHRVFPMIFNWEDYHLHDFVVGQRVYSVPDPDDDFNERKVIDEKCVPLNRIVASGTRATSTRVIWPRGTTSWWAVRCRTPGSPCWKRP